MPAFLILLLFSAATAGAVPLDVTEVRFGAIPDDRGDDSHAIQQALDTAVREGGGEVLIPPGEYEMHHKLRVGGSFRKLVIRGAGNGLTRFLCRAPEGFLEVLADNANALLVIRDFNLRPTREGAGTALRLVKPYAETADGSPSLALVNLMVLPLDITRHYFRNVIHADGWSPLVENVNSSGPYGPQVDISGKAKPDSVLVLRNAWHPRIRYCHFWSAKTGVDVELTDASPEPTIESTVSVECARGIIITQRSDAPLNHPVVVRDNHWNNWEVGLLLHGVDGFRIVNNVPYFPRGDMEAADYHDILLEDSSDGVVELNQFWFLGATPRVNLQVAPGCNDIRIARNYFGFAIHRNAISIAPDAKSVTVEGNDHGGVYAMDEPGTFAIWEFDRGGDDLGMDKSLLQPGRRNDLVLQGAKAGRGWEFLDSGDALVFNAPEDVATSSHDWPGSSGVDLRLLVQFDSAAGERTVLEVPGVFRLYAQGTNLVFEATDQEGNTHSAKVDRAALPNRFFNVRCLASPETRKLALEVDAIGRGASPLPLPLAPKSAPLTISPNSDNNAFTGAVDQIRISSAD